MITNSIFDMTVVQLVCAMRSNPAAVASIEGVIAKRKEAGEPALDAEAIAAIYVSVAVTQANVLSVMLESIRKGTTP